MFRLGVQARVFQGHAEAIGQGCQQADVCLAKGVLAIDVLEADVTGDPIPSAQGHGNE